MRINPTEPSSSGDNSNDSLGIVFNEHKLSDSDVVPYKKPSPTIPSAPKSISNTVPVKEFETSFLDGGTIITDKRNKRASLAENLNSAFSEWWGNTTQKFETALDVVERSIQKTTEEIPTVEKAETRTEIIKEASAYTKQAPKDDHSVATGKIATLQRESIPLQTKPIIIKEAFEQKTSPSIWSPFAASPNLASIKQPDSKELSILEIAALKKTKHSYMPPKPVVQESASAQNLVPPISQKIEIAATLAPQAPLVHTEPKVPTPPPTEKPLAQKMSPENMREPQVFDTPIIPIQDIPSASDLKAFFVPDAKSIQSTPTFTTSAVPKESLEDSAFASGFSTVIPPDESLESIPSTPYFETPSAREQIQNIPEIPIAETFVTETPTPRIMGVPTFTASVIPKEPLPDVSNWVAAETPIAQEEPLAVPVPVPVPVPESIPQIFKPYGEASGPVSRTDTDTPTGEIFTREDVTRSEKGHTFSPEQSPKTRDFTAEPMPQIVSESFNAQTTVEVPTGDVPSLVPLRSTVQPTDETQLNSTTDKFPPMPIFTPNVSQNNPLRTFTRWGIIFGIVLLGAGLAVFASTKFNILEEEIPSIAEITPIIIPTLFKTDSQTEILLSSNKETFLVDLSALVAAATSPVSQFYPVIRTDTEQHTATAQEIFTTLNTNLTSKTIRSLENTLILGSVTTTKNEPFMVIRSFNFDVLFSGLLAWEPYLMNDLSPFFGATNTSTSGFRDATLHNKPTRILYDTEGVEILLYSFTNQNTVIITTSRNALEQLLEKF